MNYVLKPVLYLSVISFGLGAGLGVASGVYLIKFISDPLTTQVVENLTKLSNIDKTQIDYFIEQMRLYNIKVSSTFPE